MSYILDALKKAERERAIAQVPTLMSIHDTQSEIPRKHPWAVVSVCLLFTATVIWITVYLLKPTDFQDTAPAATMASATPAQSREAEPAASPAEQSQAPLHSETGLKETRSEQVSSLSREIPTTEAPVRTPPPAFSSSSERRVQELPVTIPAVPVQPTATARSTAPAVQEQVPPVERTPPAPASLRDAIEQMTMTILVYSEVNSERMAFINDRKYVEGDLIEGRYFLQSITPEGALLSYRDERVLLRPKSR